MRTLEIAFGLFLGFWLVAFSVAYFAGPFYKMHNCGQYIMTPISQVPAVCYFAYGLDI